MPVSRWRVLALLPRRIQGITVGEIDLMRRLQKLASRLGARLFRQNTGIGWVGFKPEQISVARTVRVFPGDVVLRRARPFHAGFPGLSDTGGWSPLLITADHVGDTVAIYTQAEIKDGARPTTEQLAWIDAVNAAGGRAGIARNESELSEILNMRPRAAQRG